MIIVHISLLPDPVRPSCQHVAPYRCLALVFVTTVLGASSANCLTTVAGLIRELCSSTPLSALAMLVVLPVVPAASGATGSTARRPPTPVAALPWPRQRPCPPPEENSIRQHTLLPIDPYACRRAARRGYSACSRTSPQQPCVVVANLVLHVAVGHAFIALVPGCASAGGTPTGCPDTASPVS